MFSMWLSCSMTRAGSSGKNANIHWSIAGIVKLQSVSDYTKSYQDSLEESEMIIMDCVENLLKKTGIAAEEVLFIALFGIGGLCSAARNQL